MDRLLKPEKFDTLPEDLESTKIFNYWLRTFQGFIATVAANAGKNEEINKLALLTNFLTHKTYLFIAEAATYDEAKTALTRAYHKQKNVVFARHLLMTRTQRPDESIAEYVHSFRELAEIAILFKSQLSSTETNLHETPLLTDLLRPAFDNAYLKLMV